MYSAINVTDSYNCLLFFQLSFLECLRMFPLFGFLVWAANDLFTSEPPGPGAGSTWGAPQGLCPRVGAPSLGIMCPPWIYQHLARRAVLYIDLLKLETKGYKWFFKCFEIVNWANAIRARSKPILSRNCSNSDIVLLKTSRRNPFYALASNPFCCGS